MSIPIRITFAIFALSAFVGSSTERAVCGQEDLSGVPVRFRRAAYEAPVTSDMSRGSFVQVAAQDEATSERAPERTAIGEAPVKSGAKAPLPLAPPSDRVGRTPDRGSSTGGFRALSTTFSGLAVVLGLFLLVVWLLRRQLPAGPKQLPREVLEVLGKTTIAPRQELHLIRLGGKLVLIGANANQTQSLAEITESEEVERITTACRQQTGASVSASFRDALMRLDASGSRSGRPREATDA